MVCKNGGYPRTYLVQFNIFLHYYVIIWKSSNLKVDVIGIGV
jgi:hypothetical protein